MREYDVKIESVSPLIMNRFTDETVEEVIKKVSATIPQEIAVSLFILSDGRIYQPASHIEASIIKAAANINIPGKGKKIYKDIAKIIFVEPDAIIHEIQQYDIDKRPVVDPNSKKRVIRSRPILREWALSFRLKVLDDQLPREVMKSILDYAGAAVGISDYRPKYGRFIVTKFELVESTTSGKKGK